MSDKPDIDAIVRETRRSAECGRMDRISPAEIIAILDALAARGDIIAVAVSNLDDHRRELAYARAERDAAYAERNIMRYERDALAGLLGRSGSRLKVYHFPADDALLADIEAALQTQKNRPPAEPTSAKVSNDVFGDQPTSGQGGSVSLGSGHSTKTE